MKTQNMKFDALGMGLLLLALGWCSSAAAQTGSVQTEAADEERSGNVLEEVIVTAERRDRDLLKTPISGSVISGEELAKAGVNILDELQFATPAAVVNNFGQGIDFNIRGIGKAEHNTQTTTGVITYQDGVAKFPGYFTAEPYYDIASVEVLRGPQGTFVGQNATGGAVFVNSNNPVIDGGNHGYGQVQVGNYGQWGLQGAVNMPISKTFAARFAVNLNRRDSFYDIEGPYTGDDGLHTNSARLGLLWQPNEALSVLFKTDYNYLDLSSYPADPVNSPNDLFDITANADLYGRDRFTRTVLQVDYEFGNEMVLRSISGYQDGNTAYRADLDGTSASNWTFADSVDEVIWSQEFNLISPVGERISWVAGAYWQSDEYHFLPGEFVIGAPPGSPFTEYVLEGTNPKDAQAVFGQVSFDISNSFQLEVGVRYSEHTTTNHISVVQYGLPIQQEQKADFSKTTGKVALNWNLSDDHFLYAFAASGFRPGGLNVPVGLGIPEPFDQEEVYSYEIGWKATWLEGTLRTQLNAFHNDYDNFQVRVGYPTIPVFAFQLNTPETTTIDGFEAQVQAVFGNLSLNAGLGWLTSELGAFYAVDPRIVSFLPCDPETGPETPACVNLEGHEQTYAPELTFNIGLEYDIQLQDSILTPRLNFGHIAEQWATLFQNAALGDRIEDRNILNGQIAWQFDSVVVTAFGNNLTDQHYVGAINSGLRFAGSPRQYGLRIMKSF